MESMRRKPIVAVGDLVWDVLTRPDSQLLPGGDTTGQIALSPGGSAANVATWIARAGMPATFIGTVGQDVLGDLIVADLEREGVTSHVSRITERDTGVVLVLIDQSGQRSMVTNQGADFELHPEHLPEALLSSCAHVHITGWSLFTDPPRAAALRAAELARAGGASISLDPASHQMIQEFGVQNFLKMTNDLQPDIIFPNRDEGMILTGEREPALIAQALRERYQADVIVLKLDREGCYVLADGHSASYPSTGAPALDTTGAGDSFNGAFLARYLYDRDLAAAAQFANQVGGWEVSNFGARTRPDAALHALLASDLAPGSQPATE